MVLVVRKFYSTFDLHVDLFMLVGRRIELTIITLKHIVPSSHTASN
jgi:hypothetical protein